MNVTAKAKVAAVYARFSSELQLDRSIEDQISLCRSFADRQGYEIGEIFSDRARSGASLFGRDGLLLLLERAKSRTFDVVVVEALDRLSRDQEDLAAIFKRLQFIGIDIIAVHDGKADAVQIGIRGLVGSLYLTDLANKVRRGLSGRVKEGLSAGGKAYGYKPVLGKPGELSIDPDEAAIVKRIFAEFAAGNNPRAIAYGLNREEVPPPRGAVWNASTIYGSPTRLNGILRNPIYSGRMVWNRLRMVRDPDTGKRISRMNPESEWHVVDVPNLRIVDPETAEEVNARLRGMKPRGGSQSRNKRILSGLLRCGECGSGMTIDGKTNGHQRLRCSRSRESGTCGHKRRYQLSAIETAVVRGLAERLDNPATVALYVETYLEERRRLTPENATGRNRIKRELAKRKRELERLLDAYLQELVSIEQFATRRPPLDAAVADLTRLLSVEVAGAADFRAAAAVAHETAVRHLADRLTVADPRGECMGEFRRLIDAVVIFPSAPFKPVQVGLVGILAAILGL
ncbi:recombinase family protein [Rhizobium sp. R634]|uniref:recombinase family protein n=1 Tax=Rhizobium sp. R634 TaxID=1764274 RepID=UPI000B53391A|nr:recombinase family protein [Rhizobium sp. R634]